MSDSDDEKERVAIGIDLGTTYSCVGVFRNNAVEIIANDQGNRTMPSYVGFDEDETLVGEGAKNQAARNPTNTIFDAKRLIGRNFSDELVQQDMKLWPFKVVDGGKDQPSITVMFKGEEKTFAPEEISAMVLQKMRATAEDFLGQPVVDAVITCPAYFNDSQRDATKNAGAIAGLNVLRIINEPTAAAIAYGLDNQNDEEDDGEKVILVFDLGGGTFDVSLLTIDAGVFEVRATAGDTHLGGEDFDTVIMNYVLEQFKRKHRGLDPTTNKKALRRLRTACERAKRTLSNATTANIEVESLCEGIDLMTSISRARFEDLCSSYFKNCMDPVNNVLNDLKMPKSRVDEVVLVGGSTRIPKVQEMIKAAFHGKEPNKTINPDEAVAYGAAVQAAILIGDTSEVTENILLIDVAPLSLGVETAGGMMSTMIKRNTAIPANAKKQFSTNADNQTCVEISVFEGERAKTADNNLLGKFELEGIPPAPSGTPRIEVSLCLDASGLLNVTAEEKATKRACKIEIKNSRRMTKEEVDYLVEEADKFREQDMHAIARDKARAALEEVCGSMKEAIMDETLRINKNDFDEIDKAVTWIRNWIIGTPDARKRDYDKQKEELEKMCDPIFIRLFKGQGLAARNCGVAFEKKRKLTLLIQEEARKKLMHKKE